MLHDPVDYESSDFKRTQNIIQITIRVFANTKNIEGH